MGAAGLNPVLCDVAVPVVDVPVVAGIPREIGDATNDKYIMLPRDLMGRHPVFMIEAEGLSMKDVGIMPGYILEVQMDSSVSDGDVVVAEVDGGYTVKTFYTDDDGIAWLVPENDEFDAIPLAGRQWRIIGRVTAVRKGRPRSSFSTCAKAVMRTRGKMDVESKQPVVKKSIDMPCNLVFKQFHLRHQIDFRAIRQQVEQVVVRQMKHRYEWYAAYRVLFDLDLLEEVQLSKFAKQMQAWFPDVPIQCTDDSLGEYAMGHTSKAFNLWSMEQFRAEKRKGQSIIGFNTLYHRCEQLRAALFPLPVVELGLPF